MKALVTGGGGFIGTRVCEMLRDGGHDVLALGRRQYAHLDKADIRSVQADLRDRDAVIAASRGQDVVFHVGAVPGVWGPRKMFFDINVTGTDHVIAGCRKHGVGKLVFTSSPSVAIGSTGLEGGDESLPYPRTYLAHYPASKAEAEQRVMAASDENLSTVSLRPHYVWGPGDINLVPRVIARAKRGKLVQVGNGENLTDITYIDNCVAAHLLAEAALRPGAACAGKTYFISQGEPVRIWPWLDDLMKKLGLPGIARKVSYRAAHAVGTLSEWVYGALRLTQEPLLTRFVANQLAKSHYFDISAARRDLEYHPQVSTAEGVDRLVTWYRERPHMLEDGNLPQV